MSRPPPTAILIAGPNGAGKTTFARDYLPARGDIPVFLNADSIAAGLNPLNPAQEAVSAGRLMLRRIDDSVNSGVSFALETTLSGSLYSRRIPTWRSANYRVILIFLSLSTPDLAVARVRERVAEGGHHIPENVIRRRYARGRRLFETVYCELVDEWYHYDNSGDGAKLIASHD